MLTNNKSMHLPSINYSDKGKYEFNYKKYFEMIN